MSIAILILSTVFLGRALYGQRNIVEIIAGFLFGGNNPNRVPAYSFGGNGKQSVINLFGGNNKPFGSDVTLLFGGNN